jgi:hypothetical protein
MDYSILYQTLATRALALAEVDLETFIENALGAGMSPDVLNEQLINDLTTEGPLFGKFLRNLTGASQAAALQAHRQGTRAGEMIGKTDLDDLLELNQLDIGAILDSGDPSELERLDVITAPEVALMWVAELINTCHLCLPLHGTIMAAWLTRPTSAARPRWPRCDARHRSRPLGSSLVGALCGLWRRKIWTRRSRRETRRWPAKKDAGLCGGRGWVMRHRRWLKRKLEVVDGNDSV